MKTKDEIYQEFIDKCHQKYGDKFAYDQESYVNSRTRMNICCKNHGWFTQIPANHLFGGGGCPKCKKEVVSNKAHQRRVMNNEEFITKASYIHHNKYDYSKVDMLNRDEKGRICIICPIHGDFWQKPQEHLKGKGCKICGILNRKKPEIKQSNEKFIGKLKSVHADKYDYSLVKYQGSKIPIEIICKKHGSFLQLPYDHLLGHGCPKCGFVESKAENEIYDILSSIPNIIVEKRNKSILEGKELDIYLPEFNVAIEYNGLHWHSEEFKIDKNYHLEKLEACNTRGVKLIQVFEDEWIEHKEIVLSKIMHALRIGSYKKKIRGHKCKIEEISILSAKPFLERNHIQGYGSGSVILGATFDNELVGVCIFKKDGDGWELTRMATKNDYLCHGLCGKMFKWFIDKYNPSYIKSFADRRWTLDMYNNVYIKLGFELKGILKPDYRYVVDNKRVHKFNFRKEHLHEKYGLPLSMTEKEMCDELGFKRIWDCGLIKFVWFNKN